MQGASLVPLLTGDDPNGPRDSFYYHYYEYPAVHSGRRHYGVRDQRYKLMYFYNRDEWELYDLVADPHELNNVYGNSLYAPTVERLKAELARLRDELAVPEDTVPAD